MIYDMHVELNSTYISCITRPGEVHSEAVSEHFAFCRGLGVYGYGPCLHSLHHALCNGARKIFMLFGSVQHVSWGGRASL